MGNTIALYGIVVAVALAGFAGTMWVGSSRENREGNPQYDQSRKRNLTRLTLMYVAAAVLAAAALVWFLR